MVLAGETVIAGKVPGQRIASMTPRTSNSAGITTPETVIDTVVAPVVAGRRYAVWWDGRPVSATAADDIQYSMREDSVSGTVMQSCAVDVPVINRQPRARMYAEYTADATEDKTFVATLVRVAGTGNAVGVASATQPTYFNVDYIEDA
jgi:hypothetical protein